MLCLEILRCRSSHSVASFNRYPGLGPHQTGCDLGFFVLFRAHEEQTLTWVASCSVSRLSIHASQCKFTLVLPFRGLAVRRDTRRRRTRTRPTKASRANLKILDIYLPRALDRRRSGGAGKVSTKDLSARLRAVGRAIQELNICMFCPFQMLRAYAKIDSETDISLITGHLRFITAITRAVLALLFAPTC